MLVSTHLTITAIATLFIGAQLISYIIQECLLRKDDKKENAQ